MSDTAKPKMKPAAKFLIAVAVIVMLVVVAVMGFGMWANSDPKRMLRLAFTPSHSFAEETAAPVRDYGLDESWAALPGKASNATISPEGVVAVTVVPDVDIFYVHPTTLLDRNHWTAPHDHEAANGRVDNRVMKIQASAFNLAGNVYAPRYRQATFGAFMDESGDGVKALGVAYGDVLAAFDNFIAERNEGRPFILAGHSQGSLHLKYLLLQRITGTELSKRMVAAYIIGWPVSIEADLGAMPDVSACNRKYETGCVASFQTFGLGGDPSMVLNYMETTPGLSGQPRKGTQMLCTNPQDWIIGSNETRSAHRGAVALPDDNSAPLGKPINHFSGTQCGTDGVLYLTDLPGEAWQALKMHGENYHAYDYHMFYMNIRENAAERAQAWLAKNR
jgi:hypothetical protein